MTLGMFLFEQLSTKKCIFLLFFVKTLPVVEMVPKFNLLVPMELEN